MLRKLLLVAGFVALLVSSIPPASAHGGCTPGTVVGHSVGPVAVSHSELRNCGTSPTDPHYHSDYRIAWASAGGVIVGAVIQSHEIVNGPYLETWTAAAGASAFGYGAGAAVAWTEWDTAAGCQSGIGAGAAILVPGAYLSPTVNTGPRPCPGTVSPRDLPV